MNRKTTGVRYLKTNYGVKGNRTACYLKFGIALDNLPFIDMLEHNDEFNRLLQQFNIEYWKVNEDDNYEPHIVSECVAYTYCNPDDQFDEATGRKIALTRAQAGAFQIFKDFYNNVQKILLNASCEYDILEENCETAYHKCNNHIQDLA